MQQSRFRLLSPSDTLDLQQATSEILLRRARSRGDALDPDRSWLELYTAMVDAYREQIASRGMGGSVRRGTEPAVLTGWEFWREPDPSASPDEVIEACELAEALTHLLSERELAVVVDCWMLGGSQAEAARERGITDSAVSLMLRRARGRMRAAAVAMGGGL